MSTRKAQLLELLEEQPGDIFLIYALGMEALAENNYIEALQRFNEVIQIEPSHYPAYYRLSIIYQMLDLIDIARGFAEKGMLIAKQQNDLKAASEFQNLIDELE